MPLPISQVHLPASIEPIQKVSSDPAAASFRNVLSDAIDHVEISGAQADTEVRAFLSGGNGELHSTILAAQSAELDFELLMQVRNKVVSAYEEIMRMQL